MARLPYLKKSDLQLSEQHYYDEISEKRGFFPRPFSVLLNNPKQLLTLLIWVHMYDLNLRFQIN